MKVILLADVKKVGKKDQTVEVSDGYANNFLFPRHLAVPLSKKSAEVLENQQEERKEQAAKMKADAEVLAKKLEGITLTFKVKTGREGKLFGAVSLKQVAEELAKLGMFNFSKKAEWRGYIENSTQKLADLDEKIEQKEKEKKTSKQNLEKEYEKIISDYEKELDNKYKLPEKPKDLIDSTTQTKNPELTRTEKENNRLKEVIMDAIIDLCRPVRITDLQEYSDELAEISNQKLSALLMQLVNENKLNRVIDKHMSYFIFKD